ncbi:hypothetical protein IRJ41_022658, partial [Triplophysa rosa]
LSAGFLDELHLDSGGRSMSLNSLAGAKNITLSLLPGFCRLLFSLFAGNAREYDIGLQRVLQRVSVSPSDSWPNGVEVQVVFCNIKYLGTIIALPVYLRGDASKFFRTCNSADGPDLTDTPVALLTVDDTTDAALFSPESICIVVEDEILVSGPTNLADSFLLLLGYVYALDLQYPKNLELTFTFIQKVVMCLEDNKPLKGRLMTLKNDLFNE